MADDVRQKIGPPSPQAWVAVGLGCGIALAQFVPVGGLAVLVVFSMLVMFFEFVLKLRDRSLE